MNFKEKMEFIGLLCALAVVFIILGALTARAQTPFSDIDATGCTTIDIITSCKGIVLRNADGEAKLIDFQNNTMTLFQLPKIPTQSICWFSKAILPNKKIWAVMINSVEGANYRCQIYDIKGNKYLDVDGQGGPPNNSYLIVRSLNRVRVYKTEELKIIPVNIIPKSKIKPLKSVVLHDDVFDPRGRTVSDRMIMSRELLPSGLYIRFGTNKIIYVK